MKKLISIALVLVVSVVCLHAANPKANEKAVVTEGNARFTVLTPELIRIEYSPNMKFEDNATFAVINRELPVPKFSKKNNGDFLTITTDKLTLKYRKGTDPMTAPASPRNLSITIKLNGKQVVWYPGLANPQNLRGTYRTLDKNSGDAYREKLEEGVISRSGWAVINDSPSAVRADGSRSLALSGKEGCMGVEWVTERADSAALDLYFMGYGHDYKRALSDFTKIAGKIPLPPDFVFGYWYSKYDRYSDSDYRNIITRVRDKR